MREYRKAMGSGDLTTARFVTYRIDEELLDAVTARAATCGETVTDVVVRAFRDYAGVPLPSADETDRNPAYRILHAWVLYSTEGGRVIGAYRPYHARGCPARPGEVDAAMCLCGGLISPVFNNHT